jgi:hypothetical protein
MICLASGAECSPSRRVTGCTLRVTDTQTGAVKEYSNPSGRFASVADTSAF